jgi:hypothetical protein
MLANPVGLYHMVSRHLYSWLALVAAGLTLATSSVHGLMAHAPPVALGAPAISTDVAAGPGGPQGSKLCGECLAASQARGAVSSHAKVAAPLRLSARLLTPTRLPTLSARFSCAPASPRAPPRSLLI